MSKMFNDLLREAGWSPSDVCLMRNKDSRAKKGRTPYDLWRGGPDGIFELYQSHQRIEDRKRLGRRYWASFVVTPDNSTLFVGIYAAKLLGPLDHKTLRPENDSLTDEPDSCDVYAVTPEKALGDRIGRLCVDWGPGYRAWIQHADRQNKLIRELRGE